MLYPSKRSAAADSLKRGIGAAILARIPYGRLMSRLCAATNAYVDHVDWSCYGLVGFSICLAQLTSSLYCIRRIKRWCPDMPVVVGGSAHGADSLRRILCSFPEIDLAVSGEGEIPFADLVELVSRDKHLDSMRAVPGVLTRDSVPGLPLTCRQVSSLDELPFPDFRDYFEQLQTLVHAKPTYVALPVEGSRRCSWGSQQHSGQIRKMGWAFCGLNRSWQGYRFKSASRIAAEVDALTDRHLVLSIAFTDNDFPLSAWAIHSDALTALGKDLELFAELRANVSGSAMRALGRAGFKEVQLGIEALSTPLLRKMNKGVSTIQNLQALKFCEELGIDNLWNLLVEFPSSDARDVEETLRAIQFAFPFRPCNLSQFSLQPDSLVAADPVAYTISAVIDDPLFLSLFPHELTRLLRGIFLDYRGRRKQRKLWSPVWRQVGVWKRTYRILREKPPRGPILSYNDGGSFLLIRRKRLDKDPLIYRFGEKSRALYLFCREHQPFEAIARTFGTIRKDHLRALLGSMVEQHLMFTEADRYPSLAVHHDAWSREWALRARAGDSKPPHTLSAGSVLMQQKPPSGD